MLRVIFPNFRWGKPESSQVYLYLMDGNKQQRRGAALQHLTQKGFVKSPSKPRESGRAGPDHLQRASDNYLLITVPWFSLFHCNNSQLFSSIIIPIFSILQTNSGIWTRLHLGLEAEEELLKSQFLPEVKNWEKKDTSLKYSPTKPSIKNKKNKRQKHWKSRKPPHKVWASAWETKHSHSFLSKPAAPFSISLPRCSTCGYQSPSRWCPSA